MKNIKITLTAFATILLTMFTFMPALSLADDTTKNAIQCGVNTAAGIDNCTSADTGNSLTDIVKIIINVLSVVVGVIAVIMIIFGGFRYVTSAGNDSAVTSARNTILYALVGLVIVAVAQIIVHFVLNNITKAGSSDSGNGTTQSQVCQPGRPC